MFHKLHILFPCVVMTLKRTDVFVLVYNFRFNLATSMQHATEHRRAPDSLSVFTVGIFLAADNSRTVAFEKVTNS